MTPPEQVQEDSDRKAGNLKPFLMDKTAVSRALYSLMTVLVVLLTLQDHPPEPWHAVLTLFGTTVALALVEAYVDTVAEMLFQRRRLSRKELREIWHETAPILVGAQAPTLVVLLSALGLFPIATGLTIAQAVCILFMFGFGFRVGQLLHQSWFWQIVGGVVLVAIGLLLVSLKALFH